ncbi:MAG: hypothetical protein IT366_10060 [Candidatus Hydrogenedentes bacterium]|nr:hypothetical protein [Candidatus Hydrogenedentota bacterium]
MPPLDPCAIFVQPDLRRKRVQFTFDSQAKGPFRVSIEGTPYVTEGEQSPLAIEMPEFTAWSPDAPHLYTAICASDELEPARVRFGMRECTIKENRIHFNNKTTTLRGVVLDALDSTNVRELVDKAKSAGFNFLRLRGAALPESLLDAADELGLLVCCELDAAAVESNLLERRNHPSVVMWSIGDLSDVDAALKRVHQFDPSRIVFSSLDNVEHIARYMRPYQDDIAAADTITAQLPPPCSIRAERFYENAGETSAPVFLARFGAQQLAAIGDAAPLNDRLTQQELAGIFPNTDRLIAAIETGRAESLRLHVQCARVNAKLAAYCVDGIPAGDVTGLARTQSPVTLAIRASRTNLVPREEVPVTVTIVNDERIEPIADLSLQVVGPTNQVLWKKKRSLKVPKQTREIWSGTISASGSAGVHKFVVRLMQGMKLLAQNSIDLHVVDAPSACDVEVAVLDPHAEWTLRCTALAVAAGTKPRVYVVPPLANTVRAYPENELINILNEVRAGAVALMFSPPADWNDLATRIEDGLKATSVYAPHAFHYARLHPVFDGLASRCLLFQPYRNVVPRSAFEETSDERIAGAIALPRETEPAWFGEDILVRRFGSGRIVFTHARILEHLGTDPVAERMYVNLLRHFGRRSVPGEITQPIQQTVLDWLRRERSERARLWCVIGPFPNWANAGHEAAYPPEKQLDLAAVHAGWRGPVQWTRHYAIGDLRYEINLDDASPLPMTGPATILPETYYAYAECTAPTRQAAMLRLRCNASIKVIANGAVVHERVADSAAQLSTEDAIPLTFKQGKNTILIKMSRSNSPASLGLDFGSATRDPLILKWWR